MSEKMPMTPPEQAQEREHIRDHEEETIAKLRQAVVKLAEQAGETGLDMTQVALFKDLQKEEPLLSTPMAVEYGKKAIEALVEEGILVETADGRVKTK